MYLIVRCIIGKFSKAVDFIIQSYSQIVRAIILCKDFNLVFDPFFMKKLSFLKAVFSFNVDERYSPGNICLPFSISNLPDYFFESLCTKMTINSSTI